MEGECVSIEDDGSGREEVPFGSDLAIAPWVLPPLGGTGRLLRHVRVSDDN